MKSITFKYTEISGHISANFCQFLWGVSDSTNITLWPVFALDTDGFVIPSLEIGDPDQHMLDAPEVESPKPPSPKVCFKNLRLLMRKIICIWWDYLIHLPRILEIIVIALVQAKKEENIYLGPHGAPPSQSKQQEQSSSGRKQRFKQKLKEADRRTSGTVRENKLESIRELVGGGKGTVNMEKGTSKDWLDPHCRESQFEKWNPQWLEEYLIAYSTRHQSVFFFFSSVTLL